MSKVERFTCTGCLVLILIRAVASFFPSQRLWGLNLLYYLPTAFRWIMVGMAFLVLLPVVSGKLADGLSFLFRRISDSAKPVNKSVKRLLLSSLAFPLFWFFKEKLYLLGDGNLRAVEITRGMEVSFTEPLDFFLHALVFKITGLNVFTLYALLSCSAGVVLVYLLLVLSDRMGEGSSGKVLIFSVLITMGANQLFFGYVESYALMYVATTAFVFFSWFYLQGGCKFWLPAATFLLSASFHLAGFTLLPSLVYLSFAKTGGEKTEDERRFKSKKTLSIAFMLLLMITALWILWKKSPPTAGLDSLLLYPLGSLDKSLYPLYSFAHLLDFVNHQLLVSPIGVIVWFALIFTTGKVIGQTASQKTLFLLIIVPQLLFGFLFNPQLGYPRDWDLFAFTSSGYTIWGVYLLSRELLKGKPGAIRYVTLALLGAALVSTVPWNYINATQDAAILRFNHLLNLDPQRAALGHECLAYNYRRLGDREKEVQEWSSAIELFKKPRYVGNLAAVYVELGEYQKAAEKAEELLRLDPEDDLTYSNLGKIYVMLGDNQKARRNFQKAIDLKPDNPEYYENLGIMLLNLGKYDEAVNVFTKLLQLRPDLVASYRNLGFAYANSGDHAQALKYLQLYLDYVPQTQDRIQIEAMIKELKDNLEKR